ncbi:MAG: aminotransferase DegT [Pseudomonadales bacterium]|nr:aminotransferase DegT [Pseudomonadales bacterium]|tara:strand:- start:4582 stop:5736 length:1155 start_codon:yes stop_codon:yes gene_type:complete
MHTKLVKFVRDLYRTQDFIPLHAPSFMGNEKAYLNNVIDSTFVSSVGEYVDKFELQVQAFTSSSRAIATVNGTAALHTALYLSGVRAGDVVLTQALTFVATCNAIHQLGAQPAFIDIEPVAFGMCPLALESWLEANAEVLGSGQCVLKDGGACIRAVVPMHTFGHPARLGELLSVCEKWSLCLIEDAAESLGSYYQGQHTGTLGRFGAVSFNGNKVITTGGGGMLLCRSSEDGALAKHVTTTAKKPHPFEFFHDQPGFNYRMPNLNAALGTAQMEQLEKRLSSKRRVAEAYLEFFADSEYRFVAEPDYGRSNYWLNAVRCPSAQARDELLELTNAQGVMTRPVWQLMHRLPMYQDCLRGDLPNAVEAEACLVNLPSSALVRDLR